MTGKPNPVFTVRHRKIQLIQFTVDCEIGVHDFEKDSKQKVTIDVELDLDPSQSHINDDINNVVDYDYIRAEVFKLVADGHYNLQERLCEDIAQICLAKEGVIGATVRTCKPDVYPDCQAICYEISVAR
ncbi:MAG TPA: dihydroneopterin aldolase [Rhodospirillales bacterium]|nr:dihydroneopterin aldolase [Rhodospirillales bacterium]